MLQRIDSHVVPGTVTDGTPFPYPSQVSVELSQGNITLELGEQIPGETPNTYKINCVVGGDLKAYPDLMRCTPRHITFGENRTARLAFKLA